jgi:hypothetical protein
MIVEFEEFANFVAPVVRLLSPVRELPGSNFGWNTAYSEAVHVLSQTQQINARKILKRIRCHPVSITVLNYFIISTFLVDIWFHVRKRHKKLQTG